MPEEDLDKDIDPGKEIEPGKDKEIDPSKDKEIDPGLLGKDKDPSKDIEPTGWEAKRIELSGGDEKALKALSRYSSEAEFVKAGLEAQRKLGEKVTIKGKPDSSKATEGEIIDYRKEMGIPEDPKDYKIELDEGAVLGGADQLAIDEFKKVAHELNLTPHEVDTIAKHQLALQDRLVEELAQADAEAELACEKELSREAVWGKEMNRNLNMINNLLDGAPEGVKDLLWGARLSDGSALGSNPNVLRFLNTVSRQINPLGTVVPNTGQTAIDTVESRIKEIESKMGTDEYIKDEKMQAEYRDLIDKRTRHNELNKKRR